MTVTIGGQAAYPYFVSPGQINLIVPDIGAGPQPVVVTAPNGTSSVFTVAASQYGPAFFVWPGNQVVATRTDYSLAVSNGKYIAGHFEGEGQMGIVNWGCEVEGQGGARASGDG